jgi:CRP-like cAMP-binding protein
MLSGDEIARWRMIAPYCVTLDFHDRTVVYGQGDRLASLFWVLKGIVKLTHVTEAGKQLTTDVLGPGGVFGSTLASQASEHTATTLGEIRVVKVTD